tara:strand:+ start:576 stop:1001 length:426 start_codon:yes stop_codon:yes gene_type:complete
MKLYLAFVMVFISISTFGQKRDLSAVTVGFACGESPTATPLVNKMTDLIKEEKYTEIASLLYSKIGAEIYLAIIVLEKLAEKKLYTLDETQQIIIARLKELSIPVANCYGCMPMTESMNKMLEKENYIGEVYWLDEILPLQ